VSGDIAPEDTLKGIPDHIRRPLLDEFNKLVRNYRESRWEPAELNGGKLCEIVYVVLKGYIDGSFPAALAKPRNMVAACTALEQATSAPRSVRIQIPRMLIALYEVRNNRNVGHVGADVDPSHMDATLVFSMSRWILAELIRIFHDLPVEAATDVVERLTEREVPLLWRFGDKVRVLGGGRSAKDKTLILLYGSDGVLKVRDIASVIEYRNASQFRKSVLKPAHKEDLIHFDEVSDTVTLSPIGIRYVETEISLTY
jgi:hypothetical protein